MINTGDKVRFLNDVGGGIVVKILPKGQILVKDENDFEYPVFDKDVVVIEKGTTIISKNLREQKEIIDNSIENLKDSIKKVEKTLSQKPKIEIKKDPNSEYLFAFVRNHTENYDGFNCYLINDSNYFVFYHIILHGENGYEKIDSDTLEPNTKIDVGQLSREQINNSKEIIIQSIFFDHPTNTYHEMIERKIKIVPIKFFQEHTFIDNKFFDEKSYIFELQKECLGLGNSIKSQKEFENQIEFKDKEDDDDSHRYSKRKPAETIEVDLHINKLIDSVIGLSNSEILEIQMTKFHKTMTEAIMNKAGKVVLIHGIGNGTLKASIRESLSIQYKLQFEDASFREYGFGATLVILHNN